MDVIINPIGGLANRMRAIASGIALCNEHGFNLKEIIWPINSDLYCPFEELFEPINSIKTTNISNFKQITLFDKPRKKNLFLSSLFQRNRFCGRIIGLNDNIAEYITNMESQDNHPLLIQSGLAFYDFKHESYRSIFQPKHNHLTIAENRIKFNNPIIGIHIRRTDNRIAIEKSPLSLFIKSIESELKKDENTKFYLATDDNETKQLIISIFGKDRIIHSDLTVSRTSQSGIKEALVELLCLSKCNKIYGSYWSSYSEAAAMIGNKKLIQLYNE